LQRGKISPPMEQAAHAPAPQVAGVTTAFDKSEIGGGRVGDLLAIAGELCGREFSHSEPRSGVNSLAGILSREAFLNGRSEKRSFGDLSAGGSRSAPAFQRSCRPLWPARQALWAWVDCKSTHLGQIGGRPQPNRELKTRLLMLKVVPASLASLTTRSSRTRVGEPHRLRSASAYLTDPSCPIPRQFACRRCERWSFRLFAHACHWRLFPDSLRDASS